MKYIKLFLASSIVEFEAQRKELGDYIRSLNDIYVKHDIYFELTVCEDLSNAVAKVRKQEEYNQKIRECQYFYILFGKSAGEYTIEEFDIALETFRANGAPQIYTFFLNLPEGETPEASVTEFVKRLDRELGHYYSTFSHLDSVKLNILLELTRDEILGGSLRFEGGQAFVDNNPVLSLENLPVYSKNEVVQKLAVEKRRLDEDFSELAVMCETLPDKEKLARLMKLGEERRKIAEQLHQLEMDILNLCRQTEEKRKLGQRMNWREKKALELVDHGDYEGAKAILRDAQWETEISHAEEVMEAVKDTVREYISGKRTLISTLKTAGMNPETIPEIDNLYRTVTALAEKHMVALDVLYDYGRFLYDQCRYMEGIEVTEQLSRYEDSVEGFSESERLRTYTLLANLYFKCDRHREAEQLYRKVLEVNKRLAAQNPQRYESDLAVSSNNLAISLTRLARYQEADPLYREAIEIYKRLAVKEPETYIPLLAGACNNCASLFHRTANYQAAEYLYRKTVEFYRYLEAQNGDTYKPDLATVYSNLAGLLEATAHYQEAEQLYREALEIRKKLAGKNPDAYEPDVVNTCNSLASLLKKTTRYQEAEMLERDALEIGRRLSVKNPEAFEPLVAMLCNNIADTLRRASRYQEAEPLCREALKVYRKLAEKMPGIYLHEIATVCNTLGNILQSTSFCEAEDLYREALTIYRNLALENTDVYTPDVAASCNNLAGLLAKSHRYREAEELLREAHLQYLKASFKNPGSYEQRLAMVCDNLATLLQETNRPQEAEMFRWEADVNRKEGEEAKKAHTNDIPQYR